MHVQLLQQLAGLAVPHLHQIVTAAGEEAVRTAAMAECRSLDHTNQNETPCLYLLCAWTCVHTLWARVLTE